MHLSVAVAYIVYFCGYGVISTTDLRRVVPTAPYYAICWEGIYTRITSKHSTITWGIPKWIRIAFQMNSVLTYWTKPRSN